MHQGLVVGAPRNATMHRKQLNAYRINVPKFEVRVMVSSELGSAAIWSCEL